jgi:hypothetical protein
MGVDTGFASSIFVRFRIFVMYHYWERRTLVAVLMTSMPRKNLRGSSCFTANSELRLERRVSITLFNELVIMISST